MTTSAGSTHANSPTELVKLLGALTVGQSIGAAFMVGCAQLLLERPPHMLLPPFFALAACGPVLAPFLWWARIVRAQPRRFGVRLGMAMFIYLEMFTMAMLFGASWLGILPEGEVLTWYLPVMVIATAIVSYVLYLILRSLVGGKSVEAPE